MTKQIIVFLSLFIMAPAAFGGLFKCTDKDGAVTFSDVPCASGAEEVKGIFVSDTGSKNDDTAIENCINFLNRNGQISDPEGVKVQSHDYEWVTVKNIGARRMLHLMVNVRNQYGAYDGPERMQCLMMGDGQTVNSNPFELVK